MVNKKLIPIVLVIIFAVIGIVGWQLYNNQNQNIPSKSNTPIDIPSSTQIQEPNDFTASFEIYTNGTKRIFTASMYHNKSPDVFIQNPDPSIIYVKKAGVTWNNFFSTLPFSLSEECLVTGTKQTFCNTEEQRLRFFLNNVETPDALDLKIQPGDSLRVTYGQ